MDDLPDPGDFVPAPYRQCSHYLGSFNVFNPDASTEFFGKPHEDTLWPADETQPINVLILRDLPNEFSAMLAEARDDIVDVLDGKHDPPYSQSIDRRVLRLASNRGRTVELRELDFPTSIWSWQQGDLAPDVLEGEHLIHPASFDLRLPRQLHAKLEEESLRGLKIIDDDEHVIHPN
jgi:hypothetical protein